MKMKSILIGVLLTIGCVLPCIAESEIAYVDLERIFDEYYKTELGDAQLKELSEEFNEEREGLIQEYEELQKKFDALRSEAQSTILSEEVKQEKRDAAEDALLEMRDYERRIRRFDESRTKQLEEQQRRVRKRLVKEIRDGINLFAEAQGYQAVVDTSGQSLNTVEIFLYVDSRLDITDQVIERLNKNR